MKYDLEDLKQISDELLPEADYYMKRKIVERCLKPEPKKKAGLWRWSVCAAAGFTVCALAVFCVALSGVDVFGFKTRNAASANAAQSGTALAQAQAVSVSPMSSPADNPDLLYVGADSAAYSGPESDKSLVSAVSGVQAWCLAQDDNGLYGVKDAAGQWVIKAQYEQGSQKEDVIILVKDGVMERYSVSGQKLD